MRYVIHALTALTFDALLSLCGSALILQATIILKDICIHSAPLQPLQAGFERVPGV